MQNKFKEIFLKSWFSVMLLKNQIIILNSERFRLTVWWINI